MLWHILPNRSRCNRFIWGGVSYLHHFPACLQLQQIKRHQPFCLLLITETTKMNIWFYPIKMYFSLQFHQSMLKLIETQRTNFHCLLSTGSQLWQYGEQLEVQPQCTSQTGVWFWIMSPISTANSRTMTNMCQVSPKNGSMKQSFGRLSCTVE